MVIDRYIRYEDSYRYGDNMKDESKYISVLVTREFNEELKKYREINGLKSVGWILKKAFDVFLQNTNTKPFCEATVKENGMVVIGRPSSGKVIEYRFKCVEHP